MAARTHVLIAAIGNSDVQDLGPGGIERSTMSAREHGQLLLELLDSGADPRELYDIPIIRPVLRGLIADGGMTTQMILIATDQPDGSGEGREKDTIYYAELVRRYVEAAELMDAESVQVTRMERNPADYGETFPFCRSLLAELYARYGDVAWHISVSGGTPALTAALVTEGVNVLGPALSIRYKDRESATARELNVAQDLRAQLLRRSLETHIQAFNFTAAHELCEQAGTAPALGALIEDAKRRSLFRALLRHAYERLNANLVDAHRALLGKDLGVLRDEERSAVTLVVDGVERDRDAQTVREVIAAARIMYLQRRYFDFVTRVATFLDTCIRYVALYHFGIEETLITDSRGSHSSLAPWVDNMSPEQSRGKLRDMLLKYDDRPSRYLYRQMMYALPSDRAQQTLVSELSSRSLADLAELRNGSVHRYDGIGQKTLEDAWHGDPRSITETLSTIAQHAGITGIESDPYAMLRNALLQLLSDSANRAK
jgi:hypothetical protein